MTGAPWDTLGMARSPYRLGRLTRALLVAAVTALALLPFAALADSMAPSKPFELTAHGVTFQIPEWKAARPVKPEVGVFEYDARAKGGDDFFLLMLTVEAGPPAEKADWKAIAKNIIEEAKKGGAELTLEPKGDFADASGFKGQRMLGTMKRSDQTMAVELIALLKGGKLVTISVVSGKAGAVSQKLAAEVAKTTKLKAK